MRFTRRQSFGWLGAAVAPAEAIAARHPPQPPIRLVILDIGGTIIEDRGDIPTALAAALGNHGVASTAPEIARLRGASKKEIIRHFVDQQTFPANTDRDRLSSLIYDEFTANIIRIYQAVPPIAGAEDTIRQLRKSGYLVATTTGFDRAITASIFNRLGWQPYFAATISSDDVAKGRPSPFMLFHAMESAGVNSVAEVIAVGDTPLDLEAGTNAGLRGVIGVLSGAGTTESLNRTPHTHVLPSVAGLPALLAAKF